MESDAYNLCQSCHGKDLSGNEVLGSPSIAGMEEWYLLRQISNFKDGIRGTHDKDLMGLTMRLSVMNLNDEQKRSLSSKISLMKSKKLEQSIQGDLVTGEFVFQHCISCHGEFAEGDATISAPKLTGQNDWYIYRQLINFQKGIRGQHPEDLYGRQMMEMAEMFNEEMFRDVTAYISQIDQAPSEDR
tara:strand:+ start:987 stop:1547 length:561 start_codon:yes stop_codon:yes gene_type:complete